MPGFAVNVIGNIAVAKALKQGVSKGISDGLKKLTLKVEAFAKKSTVVDTGRLRSSITHEIGKDSAKVGTVVEYAEFVEYGTIKMEPRHMEASTKVLGQGMMAYTVEKMGDDIKEFEKKVISDTKKRF